MIEETIGKVPLPGIDAQDHHKPTDIWDQKPEIDLGVPDEISDPLPEGNPGHSGRNKLKGS
jgi:hypothetical protein